MGGRYFKRPFRPKLSAGELFVTATGMYLVTKSAGYPDGWDPKARGVTARQNAAKYGLLCVRLLGEPHKPLKSAWTTTMWELAGNYRILEKDEGIELVQDYEKVHGNPADGNFYRKLLRNPTSVWTERADGCVTEPPEDIDPRRWSGSPFNPGYSRHMSSLCLGDDDEDDERDYYGSYDDFGND